MQVVIFPTVDDAVIFPVTVNVVACAWKTDGQNKPIIKAAKIKAKELNFEFLIIIIFSWLVTVI